MEEENKCSDKQVLQMLYGVCWDYLKFYQELLLKFLVAYTAISGGIVSFWITHPTNVSRMALLLPIIIGVPMGLFFLIAPIWAGTCQEVMKELLDKLEAGVSSGPSALSYSLILVVTGFLTLTIAAGCIICLLRQESNILTFLHIA
jgi:hypothetical protein